MPKDSIQLNSFPPACTPTKSFRVQKQASVSRSRSRCQESRVCRWLQAEITSKTKRGSCNSVLASKSRESASYKPAAVQPHQYFLASHRRTRHSSWWPGPGPFRLVGLGASFEGAALTDVSKGLYQRGNSLHSGRQVGSTATGLRLRAKARTGDG